MPTQATLLFKAAGLLVALTSVASAQQYPAKPVRLIIPAAPGAINDTIGRMIGTQLGNRLGKQFVIDNRAGAGTVIGTELAANAPKDGYTLLIVSLVHTINPWLYKLNYDPIKAFAPIATIASSGNVVVVNPALPVHSIKELIALARKQPGKLQYASGGVGSFMHLGGELFKIAAGVDLLNIPFKSGGPAVTDVIGGHTKVAFPTTITATPHVRSGKLRALGVGSAQRQAVLPEVPTVAEAGLPGYEVANWIGIVAPAGTPQAIVERLNNEISAILDSAEVRKQLANDGAEPMRMSTAEFAAYMEKELAKWGRVVKEGGIKPAQ